MGGGRGKSRAGPAGCNIPPRREQSSRAAVDWRQASLAAQHPRSWADDARQEMSTYKHWHHSRQQAAVLYEETPLAYIVPHATHILVPNKYNNSSTVVWYALAIILIGKKKKK